MVQLYLESFLLDVGTNPDALMWILHLSDSTGRLALLQLQLSELKFDVVQRAGIMHQPADALSPLNGTETDLAQIKDQLLVFCTTAFIPRKRDAKVMYFQCYDELNHKNALDYLRDTQLQNRRKWNTPIIRYPDRRSFENRGSRLIDLKRHLHSDCQARHSIATGMGSGLYCPHRWFSGEGGSYVFTITSTIPLALPNIGKTPHWKNQCATRCDANIIAHKWQWYLQDCKRLLRPKYSIKKWRRPLLYSLQVYHWNLSLWTSWYAFERR